MLTTFNLCEAILWLGIAFAFAITPGIRGLSTAHRWWLVIAFSLFGISDFIEIRTGAFWRPWWLLLWTTACLVAIVIALAKLCRRRLP